MKKLVFTLGFFIISIKFLVAQDVQITGQVLDTETRIPINYVEVIDKTIGKGVLSDSAGNFAILVSEENKTILTFLHLGYATKQADINPKSSKKNLIILLDTISRELEEVEIIGISDKNQPFRVEQVEINLLRNTNLFDVGDYLRQIPNVGGIKKGARGIDPVVRGFKYSQLNVQVDGGLRIEGGCPNRMDPTTSHIDMTDVQEIRVLKGPYALKYGTNFGGIIDIITWKPEFYHKYKTNFTTFLGAQNNHTGLKTNVGVNGANKLISYNISGGWNKYGDYRSGNGDWIQSSLEEYALILNLGFKITPKQVIYATYKNSQGRNVDFPALTMDERKDDTELYSLNYFANNLSKAVNFIRFKAYLSDVKHLMDNKMRPLSDTVVATALVNAKNLGGKFGVNLNILKGKLEIGSDYEHIYKNGDRTKNLIMQPMLPVLTEDLWSDAHINNIGFFGEYQVLTRKIDWVISARLDFNKAESNPMLRTKPNGDIIYENANTSSQFTNFSFSGGLTWYLNESMNILLAVGHGVRSPDMSERFITLLPVGYDLYDYLGNPQLEPEVNNEIDLGLRSKLSTIGEVELSTFFSYVNNYITGELVPPSEVKPQTPGVLGVKRFVNLNNVFLTGFELSFLTPNTNNWQIKFNAAYTIGENPALNEPLPEIAPLEARLAFSYRFFNEKLVPQIDLRIVAAQNRVAADFGEIESPGFALLGFVLNYQFSNNLTIVAGVKNIFNTNYYEHLNRMIIGTKSPFYEPGRIFYGNLIFKL